MGKQRFQAFRVLRLQLESSGKQFMKLLVYPSVLHLPGNPNGATKMVIINQAFEKFQKTLPQTSVSESLDDYIDYLRKRKAKK